MFMPKLTFLVVAEDCSMRTENTGHKLSKIHRGGHEDYEKKQRKLLLSIVKKEGDYLDINWT